MFVNLLFSEGQRRLIVTILIHANKASVLQAKKTCYELLRITYKLLCYVFFVRQFDVISKHIAINHRGVYFFVPQ